MLSMAAFAFVASISPGPLNIVSLSCGTRYGIKPGLVFVTGASFTFIALFLAVGVGLNSILLIIPEFNEILRWGGIAFLLYLSVILAMDNGSLSPVKEQAAAPGLVTGALVQVLNPKAWLAAASGIGAYTSGGDLKLLLIFAAIYLPVCWLSLSCWVYAGAFLRRYAEQPVVLKIINRCLAGLLVLSCLYLIID